MIQSTVHPFTHHISSASETTIQQQNQFIQYMLNRKILGEGGKVSSAVFLDAERVFGKVWHGGFNAPPFFGDLWILNLSCTRVKCLFIKFVIFVNNLWVLRNKYGLMHILTTYLYIKRIWLYFMPKICLNCFVVG